MLCFHIAKFLNLGVYTGKNLYYFAQYIYIYSWQNELFGAVITRYDWIPMTLDANI